RSTSIAYAASNYGVHKTTDAGINWNQVISGLTNISVTALVVDPSTPATVYAGTEGGGVFKRTNSGGSWSPVNTGLPANADMFGLAIDPVSPNTLYASELSNGVFKT